MNTKNYTLFDKIISRYRLSAAARYIERDDVVLDLGCGVQHYLLRYGKDKFKLGYGLDYDVENCQKSNITLRKYKYEGSLPLEENFFDKVFLVAVLEHIEEKNVSALFSEFFRVLKKNGRVVMTTPTPRAKAVLEFIAFKIKMVAAEEIADHKQYYTAERIHGLAAANGLSIVESRLFQLGLNSLYVMEKRSSLPERSPHAGLSNGWERQAGIKRR